MNENKPKGKTTAYWCGHVSYLIRHYREMTKNKENLPPRVCAELLAVKATLEEQTEEDIMEAHSRNPAFVRAVAEKLGYIIREESETTE